MEPRDEKSGSGAHDGACQYIGKIVFVGGNAQISGGDGESESRSPYQWSGSISFQASNGSGRDGRNKPEHGVSRIKRKIVVAG